MESESELSPFHLAVIDEYLASMNATRSYLKVYPKFHEGKETTYGNAATQASLLLKMPHIREEIRAAQADLRKRCRVRAEKVIRELGKIAFSDIDDIIDLTDPDNPRLRPRKDIPAAARQAIQEVSRTQFGVKVKLVDKLGALRELARILGLYKEPEPLEILLARLPPDIRETVRAGIAAGLLQREPPGSELAKTLSEIAAGPHPSSEPLGGVSGDGHDAGPVAGTASDTLLSPGRGNLDLGSEDLDALFNCTFRNFVKF